MFTKTYTEKIDLNNVLKITVRDITGFEDKGYQIMWM